MSCIIARLNHISTLQNSLGEKRWIYNRQMCLWLVTSPTAGRKQADLIPLSSETEQHLPAGWKILIDSGEIHFTELFLSYKSFPLSTLL